MRIRLVVAAMVLAVSGCGFPDSRPATEENEPYVRVDERVPDVSAQFLFERPLGGLASREHYVLDLLYLTNKGHLTLYSHFNGFSLRDGVRVTFAVENARLRLRLAGPGLADQLFDLPEDWLTPDRRLKVRLEIHNQTASGPRVLIWRYHQSLQGEALVERPFISAGNADFDSAARGVLLPYHGRGVRWGIETEQVRLTSIHREAPYAP